mgnify:CR=1 FL=1
MCIRDRYIFDCIELFGWIKCPGSYIFIQEQSSAIEIELPCLLYTSDAADERSSVDLGGRRIIKKKNIRNLDSCTIINTKTLEIKEL